jgi:hypothetical protein
MEIRPPLDVDLLCRRYGERHGRRVKLIAHPFPSSGPSGALLRGETADYIFYQARTTPAHQRHIKLHEFGHLVAQHQCTGEDGPLFPLTTEEMRQQFPDLDPTTVGRALSRTHFDSYQERVAETVATIVLEWAAVLDPVAGLRSNATATRRLEQTLADRLGWL